MRNGAVAGGVSVTSVVTIFAHYFGQLVQQLDSTCQVCQQCVPARQRTLWEDISQPCIFLLLGALAAVVISRLSGRAGRDVQCRVGIQHVSYSATQAAPEFESRPSSSVEDWRQASVPVASVHELADTLPIGVDSPPSRKKFRSQA